MMQHAKRWLTTLIFGIALYSAMSAGAQSDNVLGITVTPAKFEAAMAPGSTYNVPITVNNTSFDTNHIAASLSDFDLTTNGDYRFGKVGSRPYSILKYAAIRPREFDIPAKGIQQVELSLVVPNDQSMSGEYAGVVFFQTRPKRGERGVFFSARVATKLYVMIQGTEKIDGAITKMSSTKTPGGQSFRVTFKNTGNAHVYTRGQLTVQQGGSVIYQVALPENILVERGGERLMQVLGKSLKPGSYQAIATLDYGGRTETGGQINFDVH